MEEHAIAIDEGKTMKEDPRSTTSVKEEANEGEKVGLINKLISLSTIIPTEEVATEEIEEEKEEEQKGGILENLIANLTSPRAASKPEEGEFFQDPEDQQTQTLQDRDDGDGGGGLVGTIVSNLPISIADNEGPSSDEASMLIHSVVHD